MVNPELSDEKAGMLVAETDNEAPFAYVETNSISRSAVEALHPIQRESLLADTVILEEGNDELQSISELPSLITHEGSWNVSEAIDMQVGLQLNEAMDFTVAEDNSQLTLTLEEPENLVGQEVFLYFEGIDFQPPEALPGVQASTSYRVNVTYNDQEKSVLQSDKYTFSSYFKRENILLHLNEVERAEEELVVEFEDPGHYSFENVSIVSRPLDEEQIARDTREKNDQALNIDAFTNEQIKGSVDATEAGMLVTNIPYSPGWQAYIDNEEVPTEKINIGFVGVPLAAGEHTVEFTYQTPFLKLGVIITSIGVIILIGYAIVHKRFIAK